MFFHYNVCDSLKSLCRPKFHRVSLETRMKVKFLSHLLYWVKIVVVFLFLGVRIFFTLWDLPFLKFIWYFCGFS